MDICKWTEKKIHSMKWYDMSMTKLCLALFGAIIAAYFPAFVMQYMNIIIGLFMLLVIILYRLFLVWK